MYKLRKTYNLTRGVTSCHTTARNQQIQKNAPVIEAEIVEDKKEPSSSVSSSKSFSKQKKEEATPWDSGCLILLLITLFLWWFPPGYILALIGLGVWKAVTRD